MSLLRFFIVVVGIAVSLTGCQLCDDPIAPSPTAGSPELFYTEILERADSGTASRIFRAKADGTEQRVFATTSGYITNTGRLFSTPRNGRIVFVADPKGTGSLAIVDLTVANVDGSNARVLANDVPFEDVLYAAISPDGEWVAVSDDRQQRTADLVVYNVSTSTKKIIATDLQNESPLTFSPDSRRLFFYTSSNEIISINIDGSDRQVIVSDAYSNNDYSSHLDISPDGSKLVYMRPGADLSLAHLAIHDLATGISTALGGGNGVIGGYPVWSPTGDCIAYIGIAERPNGELATALVVHSISNDSVRTLTSAQRGEWPLLPQWSPKGDMISAMVTIGSSPDNGTYTVRVFDVATGQSRLLGTNVGLAYWVR